ncbi:MAG: PhoH family protein, partial [Deltaproteobacteria bacterium]|nr:PhoH family protein [Deltaproteobacteria bacterium]
MREAGVVNEAREETIRFEDASVLRDLFGVNDAHLRVLERALGVTIRPDGNEARVAGDGIPVELAGKVLSGLYRVLRRGIPVTGNDVEAAIRIVSADRNADVSVVFEDVVFKSSRNRTITPKSVAQKRYLDAIREFDIVFGVGPAGTGKTFLA